MQDWTSIKISLLCEDAFIVYPPEGVPPSMFEITDKHEAVVVLHGKARCVGTREKLTGPCLIPRSINHIMLEGENTILLVVPKLGSGEELKKRADKKKETLRMKTKEKPYLRLAHFARDFLSQCWQRWQERRLRVEPGAQDDVEHGNDLDQEQQCAMAEMECLSSDSPIVGVSEAATSPCEDIAPHPVTPIIQVVGESGLQEQYGLDNFSPELPLSVPGTPVQSA